MRTKVTIKTTDSLINDFNFHSDDSYANVRDMVARVAGEVHAGRLTRDEAIVRIYKTIQHAPPTVGPAQINDSHVVVNFNDQRVYYGHNYDRASWGGETFAGCARFAKMCDDFFSGG